MTCQLCAREIEPGSTYCRFCGAPAPGVPKAPRRLVRLPDAGRLGGVCAGLAAYFDADVTLVRLAVVILAIWPGSIVFGVIAYLIAWLVMPPAEGSGAAATDVGRKQLYRSRRDRQLGGVCGGLAEFAGADPTLIRLLWAILTVVPGIIVFGLLAYILAWIIIPEAPEPAEPPPVPVV